jgi:hypothetical protein
VQSIGDRIFEEFSEKFVNFNWKTIPNALGISNVVRATKKLSECENSQKFEELMLSLIPMVEKSCSNDSKMKMGNYLKKLQFPIEMSRTTMIDSFFCTVIAECRTEIAQRKEAEKQGKLYFGPSTFNVIFDGSA